MRWYVADFETTDEEFYIENGYTMVWLWSICDSEGEIYADGTTIESFFKCIKSLSHTTLYFHNLKFDGSFILDYLLSNGIQYVDELKDISSGFTTLIDDMGAWYKIVYKWSKTQSITIIDSLKILPFRAEIIAKDFELPIRKGKIDYSKYEVNDNTLYYIHNDVRIIAYALNVLKSEGLTKMTIGSCAYNNYSCNIPKEVFNFNFPDLDIAFLKEWRSAYRGGRCQVNPIHANKELTNVNRFDINSMYPYIMYSQELPYGQPIVCSKPGEYNFELYHVRIAFMLKEGHIPTLLKKGFKYIDETYYESTDDIEDIWLSSIDMKLLERHYYIYHLEYISIIGFHTSKILFSHYVKTWYKRKQESVGAKRVVCKLMLNSLYGKFGTNPMKANKIPYYDNLKDQVNFKVSEEEEGKHYYLPMAIAITSYAHLLIDDAIIATGVDNFVYCDTDSVHTLGTLPTDWIHATRLGAFKHEACEERSKYIRSKTYITYEKGEYSITCAGMPDRSKEMFIGAYPDPIKEFKPGATVGGKLLPKRVKGGTILHETYFTIKS